MHTVNELSPAIVPAATRKLTVEAVTQKQDLIEVPGVYFDLPARTYHSSHAVSNSMLKHLSPPARLPAYLCGEDFEETWAMRCGTLVHHSILEPGEPLPRIVEIPTKYKADDGTMKPWNRNAKTCQRFEEEATAAGKLALKGEEIATVNACIRAVAEDKHCRKVFRRGQGEVSLFDWVTLPSGAQVFCKGRVDYVPAHGSALVDIKVVMEGGADPVAFAKVIAERRYHVAAAHYLNLWNQLNPNNPRTHFVYVVVEREAPNLVATYSLGPDSLAIGQERLIQSLEQFAECQESGNWHGFELQGFRTIEIPKWANK
jgi:PDDEXK-like domain of unknown function (DUF3799)